MSSQNNKVFKLIRSLEKTGKEFWNISPESGAFLNALIKTHNFKRALEIGSSNGYSGLWIAEALAQNNGILYTIESHKKERFGLAQQNFESSGLKNIKQILGHAPEAIPKKPKEFDFVFLDATKKEYPRFFEAMESRVKLNGVIVADNIHSHHHELLPYIRKVKSKKNWNSILLNLGSGMMISQKIS